MKPILEQTLWSYFSSNPDIVALKVYYSFEDVKEPSKRTPYILISRYDPEIIGLTKYSGMNQFFIDLFDRSGFAIISHNKDEITISEEPDIINYEYKSTITEIVPMKKAELATEELLYVFGRPTNANTVFDDTDAFQKFYGLKNGVEPANFISDDKMQMKFGHIQEEFDELKRAYSEGNLTEAADAIIDLIYVTSGLGNLMNLPMNALWRDVQNSNMIGKERVTSLNNATKRGTTFDVRKTKEWIGPRGKEIIEEYNKQFEIE